MVRRPHDVDAASLAFIGGPSPAPSAPAELEVLALIRGEIEVAHVVAGSFTLIATDVAVRARGTDGIEGPAVLLVGSLSIPLASIERRRHVHRLAQTTLLTLRLPEAQRSPSGVVQTTLDGDASVDLIALDGDVRILVAPGLHEFFFGVGFVNRVDVSIPAVDPPLFRLVQLPDFG